MRVQNAQQALTQHQVLLPGMIKGPSVADQRACAEQAVSTHPTPDAPAMIRGPSMAKSEHMAMALRRPYRSIRAPPTNAPTNDPSFKAPTMLDCTGKEARRVGWGCEKGVRGQSPYNMDCVSSRRDTELRIPRDGGLWVGFKECKLRKDEGRGQTGTAKEMTCGINPRGTARQQNMHCRCSCRNA
eukprot:1153933-Pelagomonas_calceolata.AAC.11